MENPIQLDPDERVFTFHDIASLFRSQKQKLLRIAILGALVAFGAINILRGPQYKVEATFRDGGERNEGGGLKDLLIGMGGTTFQSEAVTLMKSRCVLGPLVQKLGLQASVPQSRWIVAKLYRRFRDNWKAERGKFIEDLDSFVFANVVYYGENALGYQLRFEDPKHFAIYEGKTLLCKAAVGQPLFLPGLELTLIAPAKSLKIGHFYSLSIEPWVKTVDNLRNQIQIASQKQNKSVYEIKVLNRDRKLALQIVNGLMDEYQAYLKQDYEVLAKEQLSYLERRQGDICKNMEHVFDEYTNYMRTNIADSGFFNSNEESAGFLKPYQTMAHRLFEIELETANLEQMSQSEKLSLPHEGSLAVSLGSLVQEYSQLKQQRDLLDLSLRKTPLFCEDQLTACRDELDQVRSERQELSAYIEALDRGAALPSPLFAWAERLGSCLNRVDKEDFAEYLENYAHLLSVREKMLQERFVYGNSFVSELEGITLPAAVGLFTTYNTKLDEAEAKIRLYTQVQEELAETNVELASFASILIDPFSKELIAKASEETVHLKDEKNRTSKEGQRYEEDLQLQRKILSTHLEQMAKVEEVNALLVREKMAALQQVQLDCVQKRLSVLNETVRDTIKEKKKQLAQEKRILEDKMADIRLLGIKMPDKWRQEKWLQLKTDMGIKMMEGLTEIVEAKTISHHLHRFESKPLDIATLPTAPVPPFLLLSALLGALGISGGAFGLSLIRTILKGFPSSFEKLRALRFPLLGQMSFLCDGPLVDPITGSDLETLRQTALFLNTEPKGKVIALLAGKGPDYSYALAENLARISLRSIVVRCDFNAPFQQADLPGLVQIWKGDLETLPIRSKGGMDWITAGGYTPYGVEVTQSPAFQQLIEMCKRNYNFVFILSRSALTQADSISLLRYADKAVVTVCQEPTEELTPFIDWAYHGEYVRLQFMTSL